jgi:hypothetical protein
VWPRDSGFLRTLHFCDKPRKAKSTVQHVEAAFFIVVALSWATIKSLIMSPLKQYLQTAAKLYLYIG